MSSNNSAVSPIFYQNQSKVSFKASSSVNKTNDIHPSATTTRAFATTEKDLKKMTLHDKLQRFDWQFYVKLNPDLAPHGITTKEKAIEHYTNFGFREQRWSGPHEVPSKMACSHAKNVVPPPVEYLLLCNQTTVT